MVRNELAEYQQVDQRQGHDHGEHPRDVYPECRHGRGEGQQQDYLDDTERPVLDGNPDRAPETGENPVLERENAPGDDTGYEAERGKHAAELGVGGAPVAHVDQEQDRDDHRRRRTEKVRPQDERRRAAPGLRDEAGDGPEDVGSSEPGHQVHRRVGGRGPTDIDRRVVTRGEQPVDHAEEPGSPGIEHQSVGIPEERRRQVGAERSVAPGEARTPWPGSRRRVSWCTRRGTRHRVTADRARAHARAARAVTPWRRWPSHRRPGRQGIRRFA